MKYLFTKILTVFITIAVSVSFVVPTNVVAQSIPGLSTTVPVSDGSVLKAINGKQPGVLGDAQAVVSIVTTVRKSLTQACQSVIDKLATSGAQSFLTSLGSSSFTIIGGDDSEAILNTAQAKALIAAYECTDVYVKKLINTPTSNLQESNDIAREQQTFGNIRDTLSQRVDAMNARASSSWKDVLKAIMVRTILTLNKNLTTKFVNGMVDKYKISDYLKYGDALSTQVYSMKYINENFSGDVEQQMMIRSLLQSEKLPDKVKTAQSIATSQAQQYLSTACNVTGTSSSNQDLNSYIKCLAAYGDPQANAQYHMLKGIDNAQAASAAGQANANSEISQSNGFAPPRNCSGSLTMQKQIDTQFDKVGSEKKIAEITVAKLEAALKTGKTTQAEYDKAVKARDQAIANYNALKTQVTNPIIDICESITSPAAFVSNTIGDFLKQHIDQTSNIKNDNLPFYATFLSDMASNFLNNILTGGKSNSQVLKESGTAALNSALSGLSGTLEGNGNGLPGIGGGVAGGSTVTGATGATGTTTTTTGTSGGTSGQVNGASIVLPRGPVVNLR